METAKDKAAELVKKYRPLCKISGGTGDSIPAAKEASLIAVDEILNANQIWYADSVPYKYWQEVKNELNQL
jgi:hypothetical protein